MRSIRVLGLDHHEIKLSEFPVSSEGRSQVQLLRTGTFNHPKLGKLMVTPMLITQLAENFTNRARKLDLAVDYFHESEKVAAGWITNVETRENNQELWAEIDWTPKGEERITNREIKYISADFNFNYIDNESGKEYGPTLFGAGLTNRPFVKEMQALFSENDNINLGELTMLEQVLEALKALSDEEKQKVMEALGVVQDDAALGGDKQLLEEHDKEKMAEHDKEDKMNKETEAKLSEKDAKIKELEATIEKQKKEKTFNALLSEGKVCEAQREPYMDDDMAKFAENAAEINLSEGGTDENPEDKFQTDDAQKAIDKIEDMAVKLSEEKNMDLGDATSLVLKENPELAKHYN